MILSNRKVTSLGATAGALGVIEQRGDLISDTPNRSFQVGFLGIVKRRVQANMLDGIGEI